MKELLTMTPENGVPTKILDKDLNKLKSYDAGLNYKFNTIQYESFHKLLKKEIFPNNKHFIVLGETTDFGAQFEDKEQYGPRRKKKGIPTIQDKLGSEIVLDLDDHLLPDFDPLKPIKGIRRWLKEKEITCSVTWQISSSQKLKKPGKEVQARLRLYFETDQPYTLAHRKAWSQSEGIQADGSVYTCSQPIYTAAPVVEGGVDPIPKRTGFLKGEFEFFKLPKLTPEVIIKNSSFSRGGSEYNFDDPTIPKEVLDGTVYRRYLMPLAFHYVNKLNGDREAVFAIIASKAMQVKSREFDLENTYEYIDDAIATLEEEKDQDSKVTKKEDLSTGKTKEPEFPEKLMEDWPEPWPMLYKNFSKVPRELEPALLIPTILSLNAYFLKATYVTDYNRRPNMLFLNLTGSTGNKDVNSKNVIRDLEQLFKDHGATVNMFTGILSTESTITADISFLESFDEDGNLFWINTESTRIFQQIGSGGKSNSSVAALSDKLIEVVDGHEITGKTRSGKKTKTINNPNAQILFYAQPETIERHINEEMVDSGLFGRALLSILPSLKFDRKKYRMFKKPEPLKTLIEDDFFDFYTSNEFAMSKMSVDKNILGLSNSSMDLLNIWADEYLGDDMEGSEVFQKVLSRIGNSAEQLYVIVLGICQVYDMHMGQKMRTEISIRPLIPLLEYWADTKVYAIKEFVNTSIDPYADAILHIIEDVLIGKIKLQSLTDRKLVKEYGMVSRSQLFRILQSRSKLKRELSGGTNIAADAINRATRTLNSMIENGIIIKRFLANKECVGINKDSRLIEDYETTIKEDDIKNGVD